MANNLTVPPRLTLPVSKGADFVIDFKQMVDAIYTDYAPNVTVTLEVDVQGKGKPPPPPTKISALATIATFHAVCRIEWQVADMITTGSLWRCVVSYPSVPDTTEVVVMNGTMTRYDGNN